MHSAPSLRIALAVVLLAGCAATRADPAAAGGLTVDPNRVLIYFDFEGESHDVSIERIGADYLIADGGMDIVNLGAPCDPAGSGRVRCEAALVAELVVLLGDANDRVSNTSALPLFVCTAGGADHLSGGSGPDRLSGGAGRDEVYGREGNDTVVVGFDGVGAECSAGPAESHELVDGGPGRDHLEGGAGPDVLRGGDDVDNLLGFEGDDRLDGGDGGDEQINGAAGDDLVAGGGGNDLLFGGSGDDRLEGGPGDDDLGRTVRFDSDGLGSSEVVETATEQGDDRLDGGEGNDTLVAGPGEYDLDFVDPLASLSSGVIDRSLLSATLNGADTLVGGPGRDFASYINRDLPVTVSLDGLANDGSAGEGDRVDADIELVTGGARADVLIAGPDGADLLFGDLGPDTILGGPGADTLSGGGDDAVDRLEGAGGDDELRGGPGDDDLGGGPGRDVLIGGDGDDGVSGDADVDSLEGGTGSDRLDGGSGDDCLHGFVFPALTPGEASPCPRSDRDTAAVGADGDDVLHGGPGADRLNGGAGEDVADYATARAPVAVALAGVPHERLRAYGRVAVTDLVGADVDGIRGGRGDDTLLGNAGDNVLDGGPGDDHVVGGRGVDRLRGGSGRDVLVGRDGEPDAVRCGTKRDIALVDGADEVVAMPADVCELADGGGSRLPGRAPRVAPADGCELPTSMPGSGRTFRLALDAAVLWGSVVDASSCRARVRGAGGTPAGRRTAQLAGGAFSLHPRRGGRQVEVRLRRGRHGRCSATGVAVRRLTVERSAPGLIVRGRTLVAYAAGAGTWTMIDGCRRTRVRVLTGRVIAVDSAGRRTVHRAPGR